MAQLLFFKETGTPMAVDTVLSLVEGDRPSYGSCTADEKRQRAFLGSADGVGVYLLNSDNILTEELINRLPRYDGSKIIHCSGTQLTEATLRERAQSCKHSICSNRRSVSFGGISLP